ncbi:fimbrial protein [Serratia marcescens]|uniref:fimbrial protein n=1 Tax=Serratia marcescens TaxID=615 RepID=UPI0034D57ED5
MKTYQYICELFTSASLRCKLVPKSIFSTLALAALFVSCQVNSACNNCDQRVELNINQQLSLSGNSVGYKVKSSSFTVAGASFGGPELSYGSMSFTDIYGVTPPYITKPTSEVFQKIDDYFSIAVYYNGSCGTTYLPYNAPIIGAKSCKIEPSSPEIMSKSFFSEIRVDKKLVGGTYSKNIFIGRYGICNGRDCSQPTATIATVYLNYNITVPQNCVINAGEVVSVDFGNIPSTAFKSPGQIAERVTPATRQLTMQCTNIEPFQNMSLRVQADRVSGNAIVSDNKDVGFILGDSDRRPITPNQFTSSIPFTISGANVATVPLTIWPVSVTGRTPAEGRVSAIGFLRVDFD